MSDHLGFVLGAYLVTAVLLLGTIAWTLADFFAQRRALQEAEPRRRERGR